MQLVGINERAVEIEENRLVGIENIGHEFVSPRRLRPVL
jgi:hypothetical protein